MHRTLRELASPGNHALYPNIQINEDTLGTSYKVFSKYPKSHFANFYNITCNISNCLYVTTLINFAYWSSLRLA